MSPLAVLTGIIMGSAVAIAVGLAMVLVVFLLLAAEHPQLAHEYGTLLRSFGLFLLLAIVAAWAFVGVVRERRWRWLAQGAIWVVIGGIGLYYWPT